MEEWTHRKYSIKEHSQSDNGIWSWNLSPIVWHIYDIKDNFIGKTLTKSDAKILIGSHLIFTGTKICPRCKEDDCELTCSTDMDVHNYFVDFQENYQFQEKQITNLKDLLLQILIDHESGKNLISFKKYSAIRDWNKLLSEEGGE